MTVTDYVSIGAAVVASAAALITYFQAKYAKRALEQQNFIKLFQAFEENSTRLFNNPELFLDVHGIDLGGNFDREGRAVAYLCSFIDAFQMFYDHKYSGDFEKLKFELIEKSSYFSKLLAHVPNQNRFFVIKKLFYGECDEKYLDAIEFAINHYKKHHDVNTQLSLPNLALNSDAAATI